MEKAVPVSQTPPTVPSGKEFEYPTAISLTGGFGRYQRNLLIKMLPISLSSLFSVHTITYALPAFICDFSVSKYHQGLLLCAIYIGMTFGGFIWGMISDSIGRRRTMLIVLAWTTIFEVISAFSLNYWFLFGCKVLSGFATCGSLTTCYTYASEFTDIIHKDTMIIRTGSSIALAFFLQPIMALIIIPRTTLQYVIIPNWININSWRLFILCCSIFPFLGLLSTLFLLEESPAFLLEAGHSDKSLKILQKMYSTNTGKKPETFPVQKLAQRSDHGGIRRASARIRPLFQDPFVLPVSIAYIVQGITMAAFSAIKLYQSLLFTVAVGSGQRAGSVKITNPHDLPFCELFNTQEIFQSTVDCLRINLKDEIYLGSVIVGFMVFISLFVTKILIEKFHKIVIFVLGHLISALCMIMLPFGSAWYLLILMSIFFVCMQNCVTISISLIVNRIPPSIRGFSMSLIMVFGQVGVILGSQILPFGSNVACISSFWIVTLLHLSIIPLMIVYSRQPNPYEEDERRLSEEAEALRYLMEPNEFM